MAMFTSKIYICYKSKWPMLKADYLISFKQQLWFDIRYHSWNIQLPRYWTIRTTWYHHNLTNDRNRRGRWPYLNLITRWVISILCNSLWPRKLTRLCVKCLVVRPTITWVLWPTHVHAPDCSNFVVGIVLVLCVSHCLYTHIIPHLFHRQWLNDRHCALDH